MTPELSSIRRSSSRSSAPARALSALAAAAALFVGAEASAAPPARTIFYNGKVFTAESGAPWATAISIKGREIQAVGNDTQLLSHIHPGTKLVNLQGRTVIPGLNDAHVHILNLPGALINSPDFIPGPGPTLNEVLADIAAATQTLPKGTWLVALVGTNITDDPNVNRFALDVVSPDHPVRLQAWSGHGTVLNSRGMQTLGISDVAADPFAGSYDRVDGSEQLNGIMHEYAEYDVWRRLHMLTTDENAVAQYRAFASAALQLGFTSVQDMAVGMRQSRSVSILQAANLPLRVRSICFPLTPDEACDATDGHADKPLLTFSGIKWVTDGTPIERNAYLREPYADDPEWRGTFNLPEPALKKILNRARKGSAERHQILFHAVGDAAVDNVLDGLDDTGGPCTWNDRRPRMEHGDLITPDNYERALDSGVVIVQNATHLALPTMHERVSAERYETIQPLRTLLDAGIPLALGTDGIGRLQSPWVDIFLASVHPDRPEEAITVEEAITAYTKGSAYAEFQEHDKGTLAPGKVADLVVLSQDVFTVPPPAIPATYSVLTMVDGQIVWDAGAVGH
jgi:predicted amidohydrolase YtcJ